MRFQYYFSIVLIVLLAQCTTDSPQSQSIKKKPNLMAKQLTYEVVDTIFHDTNAFTEGLEFYNHRLYESTGSPSNFPQTKSYYGVVDSLSGDVHPLYKLEEPLFGEGITIFKNQVYQLTYRSKKGFIYDAATNRRIRWFTIPSAEGWGLTHDSSHLIMSNGSHKLLFLNPTTLLVEKTLNVTQNGKFQQLLNELEYVNGYIYANVFMSNDIVKINAKTGKVVAFIDLSLLKETELKLYPQAQEMNGIAYNATQNRFYVTGKMWRHTYVIQLLD